MNKENTKKIFIGILGLLLIILLGFLYQKTKPYINEQQIAQTVLKTGVFAPIIYVLLASLTNIIPPFPVVPFWLVAIAIFEPIFAYSIILTANIVGNTANFLIARYLGLPTVTKLVGKKGMEKVREYTDVKDFKTFLLLRLFGGGFTDYISYAAGFTPLSVKNYLIATTIGLTPITTIGYFLMKRGMDGGLSNTMGSFGVLYVANYAISFLIPSIVIYRNKKKNEKMQKSV